jgi:phosphoglycolate phosphatase
MRVDHIIFDLDGTLIDSSRSVLDGFRFAFDQLGIEPVKPLTADVIGPPLLETLATLSGIENPATIANLAKAFKAHYDTTGYRATAGFPGVDRMLADLFAAHIPLSVATNKRLAPTISILRHLNWYAYFSSIDALDGFDPPLGSKAKMLGQILATNRLEPENCYYIGDRNEDGEAARANRLNFILTTWGYGPDLPVGTMPDDWLMMASPQDILDHFRPARNAGETIPTGKRNL